MINPKLAPLGELIRANLRDVPDFPETGVLFRDISPLLANGEAFSKLVKGLADFYRGRVDLVAGLESRMELQPDSIEPGARVLVLDDVLATGGTVNASAALIKRAGGKVESVCVLMELSELDGRSTLGDLPCEALTMI